MRLYEGLLVNVNLAVRPNVAIGPRLQPNARLASGIDRRS